MIRTHGVTHYDPDNCFGCHLRSIQFGSPSFEPHFNYAVGKYVSSWSEFNEALRKKGDAQSERTGIYSEYEPIHPSDLVNNAPPPEAPSHLDKLAKIDYDPTHETHVDALSRERSEQRAKAEEEARTKDLIHAEPVASS